MSDHAPVQFSLREILPPRRIGRALLQVASRIPNFVGSSVDPTKALANLSLAFVGVGSVGLNAVLHAARMGVGNILICDPAVLKLESTITHPLLEPAPGISKALYAGRACKAINPAARIRFFQGPIQQFPWPALADVDGVIMATDNPSAEACTGRLCQMLRRLLVHCSVHGDTLVAHAKLFSNAGPDSPCPVCLFGDEEMRQLHSAVRFSCDGSTPVPSSRNSDVPRTMSVSHLCSQSACLGMNGLTRHVLGLGEPVADTLVEYCGYTNRCVTVKLRRRSDCPCDHTPFTSIKLAPPLAESSLRLLAEAAGFTSATSWESISFSLDGLSWVESARCRCPEPRVIRRFCPSAPGAVLACPHCHQELAAQPFYSHQTVPAHLLRPFFDRPLRKLGVRRASWAVIRSGERGVFIHQQTPNEPRA